MARGKNSPALFEVIRNAQQKQKEQLERQKRQELAAELNAVSPASAKLWSPEYWLGGKLGQASVVADAQTPVAPPAARLAPKPRPAADLPVFREVDSGEKSTPVVIPKPQSTPFVATPFIAAPAAPAPVVASAPIAAPAVVAPPSVAEVAARQVRDEIAAQEAPAAEPMFAGADYHKPYTNDLDAYAPTDADHEPTPPLNLQFNVTTAIVACFAVVVAFGVFYVIGTAGRSEATPIAKNSEVRPNVLDVATGPKTPRSATPPTANLPTAPAAPTTDDGLASLGSGGESLALDTIGKPIAVPTNVKRVIGHQYLVLLSFPREQDAKDLVKFLAANGVPATAERALPDYAKSWTSVVTARGFERTRNNPAFTAYSDALKGLLQKYAGDSKFRKTFKIDVYTWRTAR